MRLWQPQHNNIIISRVAESESMESYVLNWSRSIFFRFNEVGIANRSRFLDSVKLGIGFFIAFEGFDLC